MGEGSIRAYFALEVDHLDSIWKGVLPRNISKGGDIAPIPSPLNTPLFLLYNEKLITKYDDALKRFAVYRSVNRAIKTQKIKKL